MNHDQSTLQSFLDEAKDAGEFLQIDKEVDIATEIAALCSETTQPTLFTNLKGYEGFQLADCLTRFRPTQALALGLPEGDPSNVIPGYLQKLTAGPGPTVDVDDAPIKEVIWTGDDIDLGRLPVPTPSEGADFPHLGLEKSQFQFPVISSSMGVTRHPDGQLNTFFTMARIVGPNRIHFFMLPGHTKANVDAWTERGEKCPMALIIGCHPVYEMGGCYTGPHEGFSELNIISALLGGAPVPIIKAETLDLQIPAMAEIVIEGFIDPETQPYLHASSHSDSYAPIISMEPFFDVTAITMRKNPIYRHIQPNRFTEHHSLAEFMSVPPLLMTLMGEDLPASWSPSVSAPFSCQLKYPEYRSLPVKSSLPGDFSMRGY